MNGYLSQKNEKYLRRENYPTLTVVSVVFGLYIWQRHRFVIGTSKTK